MTAGVELEALSQDECTHLLASANVGRVGISMRALPVVLPVNYAVLDGDIVIRTGAGTKLDAALDNAVVAFEIDNADAVYHEGWSVVVQGRAHEVTDPAEIKQVRRLPLQAWAGGPRDRYVRIAAERITGRRLTQSPGDSQERSRPSRGRPESRGGRSR